VGVIIDPHPRTGSDKVDGKKPGRTSIESPAIGLDSATLKCLTHGIEGPVLEVLEVRGIVHFTSPFYECGQSIAPFGTMGDFTD